MGVFEPGAKITLSIGDGDNEKVQSGTEYQVTSRAYNFAGWSLNSPESHFATCET